MDDKQKVYIRVQKERNKDIDLIFEQLGYKDVDSCHIIEDYSRLYSYDPENVELIIYPHPNGEIVCTALTSFLGELVVDNYREIKLSEMWKDGDILFCPQYKRFAIYKSESIVINSAVVYYCIDEKCLTHSLIRIEINNFRHATPQEIVQFHEFLHKHGKDWDAEKKQLISWKWKPKIGEVYVFVNSELFVEKTSNDGFELDEAHFRCGNCFRTKEEAEAMAEKVKKLLEGE